MDNTKRPQHHNPKTLNIRAGKRLRDPLDYHHPYDFMRRYRIPVKLIYCAGLRLSECLSLTVNDIFGDEGKLMVRGGKGHKDRMVPLAPEMAQDLRRYWSP